MADDSGLMCRPPGSEHDECCHDVPSGAWGLHLKKVYVDRFFKTQIQSAVVQSLRALTENESNPT